jgi:hypothetical protein
MITRVFQTLDDLQSIGDAWIDLLERALMKTPFQDPGYNRLWWDTLGGGEWQGICRLRSY